MKVLNILRLVTKDITYKRIIFIYAEWKVINIACNVWRDNHLSGYERVTLITECCTLVRELEHLSCHLRLTGECVVHVRVCVTIKSTSY